MAVPISTDEAGRPLVLSAPDLVAEAPAEGGVGPVALAGTGESAGAEDDLSRGTGMRAAGAVPDIGEQFRFLVEGAKEYAMFLLDRQGTVVSWNSGAQRIKGYAAAEIIGQNISAFYPPADVAIGKPAMELKEAGERGLWEDVGWRVRKDGTRFWANVLITALKDPAGNVTGFSKLTRDISEPTRLEESLREVEERFRLLVGGVADYGLFLLDRNGAVVSWNAGAERIKGYKAAEIIGTHFSAFYPPEDVAAGKAAMGLRRAREDGRWEEEGWRVRRDGTRFWAHVLITALRDSGGNPCGFSKLTRDMSERKAALRLREQAMADAVEGISQLGVDGRYVVVNAAYAAPTGRSPAEMVGLGWEVTVHPDDLDATRTAFERMVQTGKGSAEVRGLHKDGGAFHAHITIVAIRGADGALSGSFLFMRDVSDRKRAEAELRQSEGRLRAIVETAVDGIVTIDERGRIASFNPAAVRLFGYEPGEVIGANVNVLMPAPYQAEHDGYLSNYRTTGVRKIIGIGREVTGRRKDGSEFPMDLAVSETVLGEHRIFTGIVRDITARRDVERELAKVRGAAEDANRSKSEFLANMSHEIRTPMAAILGYADLMLDPSGRPKTRRNDIQAIRRNSQHLLQVINDVLDLSKIEAGAMTVERMAVDLPRLAAEAVSMTRPSAIEKGLALTLDFATPVPRTGLTDPLRLRQALINLISNAVKFTPAGSVILRMTCDGVSETDAAVRFEVVDTGVGMTDAEQAKLFRPFVQADASTTRRFGGTGLGLTISRQFARMLGGDITVRSQANAGSNFTMAIGVGPVGDGDLVAGLTEMAVGVAEPDVASGPAEDLTGVRVLLAEDGEDNREILTAYLLGAGATVETVEDGQCAVMAALAAETAGRPFGVVLMDMQMPVLDGYGAASELRHVGYARPIIALTAHAMAEDRAKCMTAGCDDYLTKPIDRHTLAAAVARHVDQDARRRVDRRAAAGAADADPVAVAAVGGPIRSALAGEPKLAAVVAGFVGRLPAVAAELRELADAGVSADLARAAHKLRGAGGSYGFAALSEAAARVEDRLAAGERVMAVAGDVGELIATVRRVEGYDANAEREAALA